MILAAAAWGTAAVMTKALLDHFPPLGLLILQLGASVIGLWIAAWIAGLVTLTYKISFRQSAPGLLEPGLSYMLGSYGLLWTSASHAVLIGASEPAFVLLLAFLFLRERVTPRLVGGLVSAMVGVTIISYEPGITPSSPGGDILIIIATACAALYVLASRNHLRTTPPLQLAALQQTVGMAFVLIIAGLVRMGDITIWPTQFNSVMVAYALVSGLVQYGLGFGFYLLGLRRLRATEASLWLCFISVFGVAASFVFLGEILSFTHLIGAVLIIAALVGLKNSKSEPSI